MYPTMYILGIRKGELHTDRIAKPSFATFFPECENIHLTKDVGMIPYVMHRDMRYDAILISYRNGDYPYLDSEVPGLKMRFMKKGWSRFRNHPQSLSIRYSSRGSAARMYSRTESLQPSMCVHGP